MVILTFVILDLNVLHFVRLEPCAFGKKKGDNGMV